MLTATEGTRCPTCRCYLLDQGEELVCPGCGRVEGKAPVPMRESAQAKRAVGFASSALGGFMGTAEVTYRERFSKGFSQTGSTYAYLKTISDFAGRNGRDHACASLIQRLAEKLSLPVAVTENAVWIAQKVLANEEIAQLKHRPTLAAISAYSIITACKITGLRFVAWQKVVEAFQDAGYRVKSSSVFRIGLYSPIRMPPTPPEDHLQTLLLQLRDNSALRSRFPNPEYFATLSEKANGFLRLVKATKGGHNPRALAAVAIYAAEVVLARQSGRKKMLTQKEVGEMFHVAEYTVREQYIDLFRKLVV